jgi:hypothetical protein
LKHADSQQQTDPEEAHDLSTRIAVPFQRVLSAGGGSVVFIFRWI